MPPVPRNRQLQ